MRTPVGYDMINPNIATTFAIPYRKMSVKKIVLGVKRSTSCLKGS